MFARLRLALLLMLCPALASAQNPGIFSTIKTTDTSATSACVGCTIGGTTATANSGMKIATITMEQLAAPSVTTNKLYNIAGSIYFNGNPLATGSSISGTANTIGMFTAAATMGNSIITQNGGATLVTVTGALTVTGTATANLFSGSGASLTSIPTSAVSSGNFVATVASGTGITSSVTTGNAAATTISLNNTAVTPTAYPFFTVDQQGRLTAASRSYSLSSTSDFIVSILQTNTTAGVSYGPLIRGGTNASDYGILIQNAAAMANLFIVAGNGDTAIGGTGTVTGAFTASSTSKLTGNVSIGGANVTVAVATPTTSAGCSTGATTYAGKASFFIATIGTTPQNSCTVAFNQTFSNAPTCTVSGDQGGQQISVAATTTTTVRLDSFNTSTGTPANFANGQKVFVICQGF